MDYFKTAVGQDGLKRELYEAYVGAQKKGLPVPHGLMISPPGYGKSDVFTPGVAEMTGFTMLHPVSISRNMKLDDVFGGKLGCEVAIAQAMGERPLIVLEELANIGVPNTGRLLTLLSEGYFTTLSGEIYNFGKPGVEWMLMGCCNDDGNFLSALKSRLTYFRFGEYSLDDLAEIAAHYAWNTPGLDGLPLEQEMDWDQLLLVAATPEVESPRDMIKCVRRMLSLDGVGQKHDAAALTESLRLDEDGCHADHQRTLVALLDLGGKSPIVILGKKVGHRTATVQGWCADLCEKGYIHPPKSGNGGGHVLTWEGKQKAARLKESGIVV